MPSEDQMFRGAACHHGVLGHVPLVQEEGLMTIPPRSPMMARAVCQTNLVETLFKIGSGPSPLNLGFVTCETKISQKSGLSVAKSSEAFLPLSPPRS